jgi:hypothetical protein
MLLRALMGDDGMFEAATENHTNLVQRMNKLAHVPRPDEFIVLRIQNMMRMLV